MFYLNSPVHYLRRTGRSLLSRLVQRRKNNHLYGAGSLGRGIPSGTRDFWARFLREKNVPAWIDFWGYDVNHELAVVESADAITS